MLSLQKSNFFIIIIHETYIIYLYLINSTGKVSDACIKNLGFNPFLSWSTRPEPMPIHKENWKQKWRAKSKKFHFKTKHTLTLSLSLSLSLTARARSCPWEKWRRKLRRSQYGRRWSRCDWRAKERYRSTNRRSIPTRRRFAVPSNPSSPELNKPPKTKVCFTTMCFFFSVFPSHFCKIRVLIFWVWDCVSLTQIRVLIV